MYLKKKIIALLLSVLFISLFAVYIVGFYSGVQAFYQRELFSQGVLATYELADIERLKKGEKTRTGLIFRRELTIDGAIYQSTRIKNSNALQSSIENRFWGDMHLERGLDKLIEYRKTHPVVMTSDWIDAMPNANEAWRERQRQSSDEMIETIKKIIEEHQ